VTGVPPRKRIRRVQGSGLSTPGTEQSGLFPAQLEDVQLAQEDVADGRSLTDDMQHWAESAIIALARRSATAGFASIRMLLSEDNDARRVACTVPHTRGGRGLGRVARP
jgi:hypothetical protein